MSSSIFILFHTLIRLNILSRKEERITIEDDYARILIISYMHGNNFPEDIDNGTSLVLLRIVMYSYLVLIICSLVLNFCQVATKYPANALVHCLTLLEYVVSSKVDNLFRYFFVLYFMFVWSILSYILIFFSILCFYLLF